MLIQYRDLLLELVGRLQHLEASQALLLLDLAEVSNFEHHLKLR